MTTHQHIIYALVDPRTLLVRYVGCSARGWKRTAQHGHASNLKRGRHVSAWIKSLLAAGISYFAVLLEETNADELHERERWWIAYGKMSGWDLTNHTAGGEGMTGYVFSAESRAKMSASLKGNVMSPEARAKSSAANRGRKRSDEARAKISEGKRGQARPDVSERNRARGTWRMSDEGRAAVAEGKASRSDEASVALRQKLSEAQSERRAREVEARRPKIRINLLGGL
jgi:group I intron endonuclease